MATIPRPLAAGLFIARQAEASEVRSFQMMRQRIKQKPELTKILIHKSGPLSDYSVDEIAQYVAVFERGVEEVGAIIDDVVVRPM